MEIQERFINMLNDINLEDSVSEDNEQKAYEIKSRMKSILSKLGRKEDK